MRIPEKGKLLPQPETSSLGKIERINVIISALYDNILDMASTICLKNGKVLDELIVNIKEN